MRSRHRRRSGGGRGPGGGGPGGGIISPLPGVIDIDKSGDDEGPEEPWNAVCVVGLRVYSTLEGEGVKLRVVRPREDESESEDGDDEHDADGDGDKDAKGKTGREMKLDPDDISKGAVAVVPESTGVEVDQEKEAKQPAKPGDGLKLRWKEGIRNPKKLARR